MNEIAPIKSKRTPDPILAELWEVKRQINAEAGYQVSKLVEMAHAAAVKAGKTAPEPPVHSSF
jgi:hypothetical protein